MMSPTRSSTECGRRGRFWRAGAAAFAAVVVCVGGVGGCNIAAPVMFALQGPPMVDPIVELDPKRATVIFVDDRGVGGRMAVPRRSLRRQIGTVAERRLLAEGVVGEGNMIRSSEALRAVTQESTGTPRSVVEIGRAVGAEVVIYVEMQRFSVTRGGGVVSPVASARVRVFDAAANEVIAPEDGPYPLTLELPQGDRQVATLDRSELATQREALARTFGERLSMLFYRHERRSRFGELE